MSARRAAIATHASLTGVDSARATATLDGWRLDVRFVDKQPLASVPTGLSLGHVTLRTIEGTPARATVTALRAAANEVAVQISDPRHDLAGRYVIDFSAAPGVDPLLSRAHVTIGEADPLVSGSDLIDDFSDATDAQFLAKDYASFRRLMFDRMTAVMPDWTERHAADIGVMLVEALAYVGDHLSYYQDAAATEAYLTTARTLVSARRHARLLDYPVRHGHNARVWVQLQVDDDDVRVPRSTRLLAANNRSRVPRVSVEEFAAHTPVGARHGIVFETMHDARLWQAHNTMPLYAWGGAISQLDAGATVAALDGHYPDLKAGDVLVFDPVREGRDGAAATSHVAQRHVVRIASPPALSRDVLLDRAITLIDWAPADALPRELTVGAPDGPRAVALGNIVLADHGTTVALHLPPVPDIGPYRPRLPVPAVMSAAPYVDARARARPAAEAMDQPDAEVLPLVTLTPIDGPDLLNSTPATTAPEWLPARDLLSASPFARQFVVEVDGDGSAHIRFGDDLLATRPVPGSTFVARARTGDGEDGHAGPGTISQIVTDDERVIGVSNPMASTGAAAPEAIASIRINAPVAFREPMRAVTANDYIVAAQSMAGVAEAVATREWVGSWYTTVVHVRQDGVGIVDRAMLARVERALTRLRLIGDDVEVRAAEAVKVRVALRVRGSAGVPATRLRHHVETRLGARAAAGFFHPGAWAFGESVYASAIVAATMSVDGVVEATLTLLQRRDAPAGAPHVVAAVTPAAHQVIALEGAVHVTVEGGG